MFSDFQPSSLFVLCLPFFSSPHIQINKSPIILPSENHFLPIGNILNILKEYENSFSDPYGRVSFDIASQIRRKCLDIISVNSSPSIKSRSSSSAANFNTSELHSALLSQVKTALSNIDELLQQIFQLVQGDNSLKNGYGTFYFHFLDSVSAYQAEIKVC